MADVWPRCYPVGYRGQVSTRMNPAKLDREMARRGWNATDLAKAARVSMATISGARRGRPVSNATLCKIADALMKAPVLPGVDDLLDPGAAAPF